MALDRREEVFANMGIFGKTIISEITAEQIADFEAWRISEMGLVSAPVFFA